MDKPGMKTPSLGLNLHTSHAATQGVSRPSGHPATRDDVCADFVVKNGRALYHNFPFLQILARSPSRECEDPLAMQQPQPTFPSSPAPGMGRVLVKNAAEQAKM